MIKNYNPSELISFEEDIADQFNNSKIKDMINLMNREKIPTGNESCENCAYAKERSKFD